MLSTISAGALEGTDTRQEGQMTMVKNKIQPPKWWKHKTASRPDQITRRINPLALLAHTFTAIYPVGVPSLCAEDRKCLDEASRPSRSRLTGILASSFGRYYGISAVDCWPLRQGVPDPQYVCLLHAEVSDHVFKRAVHSEMAKEGIPVVGLHT
jgi:hypothetical protein